MLSRLTQRSSRLEFSPYEMFTRDEWAKLRADTPMTLTEAEVAQLSGVIERIDADEVEHIYLPLSRLLNFYVGAAQELHGLTSEFLRKHNGKMPFIIGIAGSVAVGKSTTARALQALLARWPNHPRVDLVPTDGFLLPNAVLEERGLMNRKGFPESFDQKALVQFMADVKAGRPNVRAPVYSHFDYNIRHGEHITVDRPDVLIVEGLNVLQPPSLSRSGEAVTYVSDFFDFSIYIHADPSVIEEWYVTRFNKLRRTAFVDPAAYFHRYSHLSEADARTTALDIWRRINLKNLEENIAPTRQRADLILEKDESHSVETVWLRKL
jgi:type I pantothenate kinase